MKWASRIMYACGGTLVGLIGVGYPIAWAEDGPPPWPYWPLAALCVALAAMCFTLAGTMRE